MIKQTLKEWREEATKRFGKDANNWAFKCPHCGRINTVKEFTEAGADGSSSPYQECIGRYKKGYGCDWAAYGLFGNLGKGRVVVTPEGKEIEVFDFADKEDV